jgi:ADP-glucose pyrophosphorylase
MEFLDPEIRNQLFIENGKIYTKVKDEAPAKYNEEAEVSNAIIGTDASSKAGWRTACFLEESSLRKVRL